ncbi:MAG TPA: hypothetical protein VID74_04455 [Gemmatimonadales bacterium]|jgi:hypothetical protein
MLHRLLIIVGLVPVGTLAAQVGYPPSHSPYHELERGAFIEAFGGRVFGTGGTLKLGPRNGTSEGARLIVRGKNTLQFSFGGWTAGTQREVINAQDSVATRDKGLAPQRLIAGEIGIQLNLTGGKSWRGLAPYAGVSLGLVHGQGGPAVDTSGYSFGNKLFFAPTIGTRLYAGQRLYVKVDLRALFWKLSYPASYSLEPTKQPGTLTKSNAVNTTGAASQYTATPEIRFGLGFAW